MRHARHKLEIRQAIQEEMGYPKHEADAVLRIVWQKMREILIRDLRLVIYGLFSINLSLKMWRGKYIYKRRCTLAKQFKDALMGDFQVLEKYEEAKKRRIDDNEFTRNNFPSAWGRNYPEVRRKRAFINELEKAEEAKSLREDE